LLMLSESYYTLLLQLLIIIYHILSLSCRRVYLVVDGGRFYSLVGKKLQHTVYAQTTIIGEYYFEQYVKSNPWFRPKPQIPFTPSSYCQARVPRALPTSPVSPSTGLFTAWLREGQHKVYKIRKRLMVRNYLILSSITDKCFAIQLKLSLSVRGAKGFYKLRLPRTITAVYKKVNVTVSLPPGLVVTVKQPKQGCLC